MRGSNHNRLNFEPGMQMWSVTVGRFKFFRRACRRAFKYIMSLDGLIDIYMFDDGHSVCMFKPENCAIRARNLMQANGIGCGANICSFTVDDDGMPKLDMEQLDA